MRKISAVWRGSFLTRRRLYLHHAFALTFLFISVAFAGDNRFDDSGTIYLQSGVIEQEERLETFVAEDGSKTKLSSHFEEQLERMGLSRQDPATYIIRVQGPRVADIRRQMEAAGAVIRGYVRFYAFIATMDGTTLKQVASLDEVEWISPYGPEHRIAQPLQARLARIEEKSNPDPPDDAAVKPDGQAEPPEEKEDPVVTLVILLFPETDVDKIAEYIQQLDGEVEATVQTPPILKIRAKVPLSRVPPISSVPEVRWIEEYTPPVALNDVSAGIMGVQPEVWDTHGLTGKGQIVGHADSGLDTGSMDDMHPDLKGRIVAAFAYGRPNDWSDLDGHGTHTAGSIIGDGSISGGLYKGIAYEAELVHQSLDIAPNFMNPNLDYLLLYEEAYTNYASIFSYSVGAPSANLYGEASEFLDSWIWNHGSPKDMLMVVAAGNDGTDGLCSPGTAKNALTVGSSQSYRPNIDERASDPNRVADHSSRGPTQDGRIKPDLVAPGTWVVSTRSRAAIGFLSLMAHDARFWVSEDAGGPTSTPWIMDQPSDHNQTPVWNYENEGVFDHYLVSPPVSLPEIMLGREDREYCVQVRWTGHISSAVSFGAAYRFPGREWNYMQHLLSYDDPEPDSEWIMDQWRVPQELFGQKVEIGIFTFSQSETATADIRICDVDLRPTSGPLSDHGLAEPGDAIDRHYFLMSGTSMATPLVAGAAALTRQYYQEHREHDAPSAALLKATLINGARNITGTRPDNQQGWGRIDLENSLFPPGPELSFYDVTKGIYEAETHAYTVDVPSSTEMLRATLVWSDSPGGTLQNDLNLLLISKNNQQVPSPFQFDRINNVESLAINEPTPGVWIAQVIGQTLPFGPQPYALVVSGGKVEPVPFATAADSDGGSTSGTSSSDSTSTRGASADIRDADDDGDTDASTSKDFSPFGGQKSHEPIAQTTEYVAFEETPKLESDAALHITVKPPEPLEEPAVVETEKSMTLKRHSLIGIAIGGDTLAGARIDLEVYVSNWSIVAGHLRNGDNSEYHGYRGAIRYGFLQKGYSNAYLSMSGATWRRPRQNKDALTVEAGYRWRWPSGIQLTIGGGVGRLHETDKRQPGQTDRDTTLEPLINATVGYDF